MEKTKLVPITSLDQLEVGSVIVDGDGDRKKVLAKCGLVVWVSHLNRFNIAAPDPYTIEEIREGGYKLEVTEEPWVPEKGQGYYMPLVKTYGDKGYNNQTWVGDSLDREVLADGLVSKTKEEALAKAQKMLDSIKDLE